MNYGELIWIEALEREKIVLPVGILADGGRNGGAHDGGLADFDGGRDGPEIAGSGDDFILERVKDANGRRARGGIEPLRFDDLEIREYGEKLGTDGGRRDRLQVVEVRQLVVGARGSGRELRETDATLDSLCGRHCFGQAGIAVGKLIIVGGEDDFAVGIEGSKIPGNLIQIAAVHCADDGPARGLVN